ncbi:putative bifunctional diguanylate cyclase/phosphodiesterase [Sphingomonas immobilis]|uniref:putative bifunctional diguanylate cyclase/phosphodiesterase n=1 Tax=Sphingomonas immobilis TaxID=3063997 RepID=UPI00272A847A|nr:EAL domain-containing protein [Sphingomonas sp. CA1-15]
MGFEQQLHSARDAIRMRPASGHFVLVQIDPRSLAKLNRWPWPRGYHAQAIEMLERAGADGIAFDVDFSSRSDPAGDRKLAKAIATAKVPILLPTFRQFSAQTGGGTYENLPIPALREKALLAAVNIDADEDGMVRRYPFGVTTANTPRPSIGAMLAASAGRSDTDFAIDGAIDPATIPSISFVDLVEGRIPAGALRGKTALIGATAIELGDRYPVPRYGVIPGPTIQLLAAETLTDGSSPVDRGMMLPLLGAVAVLAFCARLGRRGKGLAISGAALSLLLVPLALEAMHLGTVDITPALCALFVGTILALTLSFYSSFQHARTVDQATGLQNRRGFEDALKSAPPRAVIAMRIESYRDTAGVLGQERAAELIQRIVDRVDPTGNGAICRLEESVLAWASQDDDAAACVEQVEGIIALLRSPLEVAGRKIELRSAFGLADVGTMSPSKLVDRAILAADQAGELGKEWQLYDDEIDRQLDWRLSLASELNEALAAGDIWVAYQPKMAIASGQVTAAEALVRWQHPQRGAILPDAFIPALEASGRILDLTLFVLGRAVADAASWAAAGTPINVAVNVSALLATDVKFLTAVRAMVADGSIDPSLLTLEVTESATMADPQRAITALEQLAALGIGLSIDDYGTGQSTLTYLKRLPAKEIKIDKSFVLGLADNRSDQVMVRSTIELAHELGYKVVAEGVETQSILDVLTAAGCDYAQGWHIGRPIRASDFEMKFCARLAA